MYTELNKNCFLSPSLAIKDTLVCGVTFLQWCTFMGFEYWSRILSTRHMHSFIFIWTFTHVKLSLYIWTYCCVDWWQLSDVSRLLERLHMADLHHLKRLDRWKRRCVLAGWTFAIEGSSVESLQPLIVPELRPRNTNSAALKRLYETHHSYPKMMSYFRTNLSSVKAIRSFQCDCWCLEHGYNCKSFSFKPFVPYSSSKERVNSSFSDT